ncbi:MAG TPA: hypothetical protein VF743_05670 [Acidimicrobiales bacterium]
MRWYTADLHLGHTNILRYCGRPFRDIDAMNEALIAGWNERVAADDEVWVLGDVALGTIRETLPLVGRLAGRRRVLVSGNHDRCWPGNGPRAAEWEARYLDAGFDEIRHGTVPVDLPGGRRVLAGHFPYQGDSQPHDRYVAHRPPDEGGWLLHGHTHGRWRVNERQVDVGVDVWDYRPVGEDELAAVIAEAEAARATPAP